MVIERICDLRIEKEPLRLVEMPIPAVAGGQVLVRVHTCGVCHTELDEIEGRTPPSRFPMVPGHQAVGLVEECGPGTKRLKKGDRVGVAWIYSSCGTCRFCREGDENLCEHFVATGRDANGGYAEYMAVPEAFAFEVPDAFSDLEAAPLLCAGTIGYRSLRLTGMRDGENIGLVGFGASAHLVIQMVRMPTLRRRYLSLPAAPGKGILPASSVPFGQGILPSALRRNCIVPLIRPLFGVPSSTRSGILKEEDALSLMPSVKKKSTRKISWPFPIPIISGSRKK
jgi:hypothetical protein